MTKAGQYIENALTMAQKAGKTQMPAIQAASTAVADALGSGGTVYTFGTGHSHLLAEEIFYRAGGLVKVYPIQEESLMLHTGASRSSQMERLPGFAAILLNDLPDIRPGDVLFVFANSGRNTVCIDMATEARSKGMIVICVTNLAHSRSVESRHPSGKKLYEVCDIVIDNCGAVGDACIPIGDVVCGPTSTMIGAMLIQAVVCGAVEILQTRGQKAEVFLSGNLDDGDAVNRQYIDAYRGQIRML